MGIAMQLGVLGAFALSACASPEQHRHAAYAAYGCDQLAEPAKAAAPFFDRHVHTVRPVHRTVSRTNAFENRVLVGAELEMHAAPGLTPEYLQRALSCHAATGRDAHPADPLHPGGRVDVVGVRSTGSSFVVMITSDDGDTAREILRRSRALAAEVATD